MGVWECWTCAKPPHGLNSQKANGVMPVAPVHPDGEPGGNTSAASHIILPQFNPLQPEKSG